MKCEKCGYPRVSFVVSRKKLWKGRAEYASRESSEPRTDFRVKPCPKCGHVPKEVKHLEVEENLQENEA